MGYGNLSHTEVTISREADSDIRPRCEINSISYGWLLDKHFISLKGIFWLKQELTEQFSTQPWDMEFIQWLSDNQNATDFLEIEQTRSSHTRNLFNF